MTLTHDQLEAIDRGEAVHETVEGRNIVALNASAFERIRAVLADPSDEVSDIDVAALIEKVAADDDANDPWLESYQIYKR